MGQQFGENNCPKINLVGSCHLLLDLLPGFVGGHEVGELLLDVLEVVIEVLLVAKVKSLGHHWVFCELLVDVVHWHAKNLGNLILMKHFSRYWPVDITPHN